MSPQGDFERRLLGRTTPFLQLSAPQLSQFWEHYCLLVRWNRVINLTRITSISEAVDRHYSESLFLAAHIPGEARRIADLGSGAGFPGLPVAVVRPELEMLLIECDQRKAAFLREAAGTMQNVEVVVQRGYAASGSFDYLISRAVRFREVLETAKKISRQVALLLSARDAAAAEQCPGLTKQAQFPLPWNAERVLLVADVSRETPRPGG